MYVVDGGNKQEMKKKTKTLNRFKFREIEIWGKMQKRNFSEGVERRESRERMREKIAVW